ncbi:MULTISPECIES: hypothetical protein [unclassified Sinorhizobium]|uniref:hypothetical protein n=1 Tax=unclassified Sinorhizobium TaxID=2613772 RepID=UPI00352485AD
MKLGFGDELSKIDRYDQLAAIRKGEPLPPPTGKPAELHTPSEREGLRLRNERWRKQEEDLAVALATLRRDAIRDETIKAAAAAIQHAGISAAGRIRGKTLLIGAADNTSPEYSKAIIREKLAEAEKPGAPPWALVLWKAALASVELKVQVVIAVPPVTVCFEIDLIKFATEVKRLRELEI